MKKKMVLIIVVVLIFIGVPLLYNRIQASKLGPYRSFYQTSNMIGFYLRKADGSLEGASKTLDTTIEVVCRKEDNRIYWITENYRELWKAEIIDGHVVKECLHYNLHTSPSFTEFQEDPGAALTKLLYQRENEEIVYAVDGCFGPSIETFEDVCRYSDTIVKAEYVSRKELSRDHGTRYQFRVKEDFTDNVDGRDIYIYADPRNCFIVGKEYYLFLSATRLQTEPVPYYHRILPYFLVGEEDGEYTFYQDYDLGLAEVEDFSEYIRTEVIGKEAYEVYEPESLEEAVQKADAIWRVRVLDLEKLNFYTHTQSGRYVVTEKLREWYESDVMTEEMLPDPEDELYEKRYKKCDAAWFYEDTEVGDEFFLLQKYVEWGDEGYYTDYSEMNYVYPVDSREGQYIIRQTGGEVSAADYLYIPLDGDGENALMTRALYRFEQGQRSPVQLPEEGVQALSVMDDRLYVLRWNDDTDYDAGVRLEQWDGEGDVLRTVLDSEEYPVLSGGSLDRQMVSRSTYIYLATDEGERSDAYDPGPEHYNGSQQFLELNVSEGTVEALKVFRGLNTFLQGEIGFDGDQVYAGSVLYDEAQDTLLQDAIWCWDRKEDTVQIIPVGIRELEARGRAGYQRVAVYQDGTTMYLCCENPDGEYETFSYTFKEDKKIRLQHLEELDGYRLWCVVGDRVLCQKDGRLLEYQERSGFIDLGISDFGYDVYAFELYEYEDGYLVRSGEQVLVRWYDGEVYSWEIEENEQQ